MRSHPCPWSKLPILALCAASVSLGKVPMALSQPKPPSRSQTVHSQQLPVNSESVPNSELRPALAAAKPPPNSELPCLDSSRECIEQLTQAAIANSPELVTLKSQIALVNERVELMGDRINYTSNRRWTNYLTTEPLRLVANIFGGGDIQRDNIAIADLEVKAATLEATRANLERRRAEVESQIREEVLSLVLEYEAARRQAALVESQLASHNIQQQLVEIDYRQGLGSTSQFLALTQQGERLEAQLIQHQIVQAESRRKVSRLTGSNCGDRAANANPPRIATIRATKIPLLKNS